MNRNLLLVAISLFTWGVGEGLFIYFQPLYLQEWGANPVMIGAIFGAMGIAMTVAPIPVGYLSDRYGSRIFMWASWILGTISTAIMALANGLPVFVVGIILYGLTGAVMAPMNSYITSVRGKLSVGRAITLCSGLYNLGAVLGPVTGGFIAEMLGLKRVYSVAAVIFLISTAIVLFAGKNPDLHHDDRESNNKIGLLRNGRLWVILGISFISLFAIYLPQPLTSNFLQNEQGLSYQVIGILGAVGSLGNAVIMLALGSLNAGAGFIIGQVLIFTFSLVFLSSHTALWFGIGYFFLGGYRLSRAMILAVARPLFHPKQTGLAYGMLETASGFAIILAPLLAGFLYDRDPYSIYRVSVYLIPVIILMDIVVLKIMQKRENKNVAQT